MLVEALGCLGLGDQQLDDRVGGTVVRHDLSHLPAAVGRDVLRAHGVRGDDGELEAACEEFGGHALALTLLGSYLAAAYEGDVRRRDRIPRLTDEEVRGGHARRVMREYEVWLRNTERGEAAVQLLRLLGLFDRPTLHRRLSNLDPAPRDIEEALTIATRGGMRLHKTDAHLETARLALTNGDTTAARTAFETARALVQATGYHRRDPDLAELESALS